MPFTPFRRMECGSMALNRMTFSSTHIQNLSPYALLRSRDGSASMVSILLTTRIFASRKDSQ